MDEVAERAVAVRAALEQSGLDHGPISVHEKMRSLGLKPVPSVASLARIFRSVGVARLEPRKKPRASYRRFVYPAPNACWQLDATEYVLTGGRKCVIFQLIDDHSRLAVASHVAWGETSEAAVAVVRKGITACGVPQRLLSDNGSALNPSRRGVLGQLVAYLRSLGVEPITGKPYKSWHSQLVPHVAEPHREAGLGAQHKGVALNLGGQAIDRPLRRVHRERRLPLRHDKITGGVEHDARHLADFPRLGGHRPDGDHQ
ncbi:hypothetical protein J2X03_002954 [Microbacterium trichothecenolyticum]|nr:hypothetical protein [Microbacterium trichothecenolyticum]